MKKKLISIFLATVIVCLSLCSFIPSVSAAENDDWVLGPYAEYITHSGKTYYHLDTHFSLDYRLAHKVVELEFADEKTADKYEDSDVYVFYGAEDVIVEADLYNNDYYNDCRIYVEESHLQKYKDIMQGTSDKYLIYDFYDFASYGLSAADYNAWTSGRTATMNASSLNNYDSFFVYSCDKMTLFEAPCGMLLYDTYLEKAYYLNYSDYDSSYFYSDGGFNTDVDKPLTVYCIEGEDLKDALLSFLYTEPVDELDWLVAEEVSESVALVFCSIVFGALPLAALVFCVVMFFVIKDKKYKRPYVVMAIGSLLILAAFAAVLLILI